MVLERLAECDEVLIVTPISIVRKRYEEELGRIAEENDYRLKIIEYRELPELLDMWLLPIVQRVEKSLRT